MHKLIYILIAVFLLACANDEIVVPEEIIQQEQMIQILADIHIAEATINYRSLSDTTRLNVDTVYAQIFKKHSVSPHHYKTSYQFYLDNPKLLNKMYDQVLNELSRRQSEQLQNQ